VLQKQLGNSNSLAKLIFVQLLKLRQQLRLELASERLVATKRVKRSIEP
jgi:hypothetical protein